MKINRVLIGFACLGIGIVVGILIAHLKTSEIETKFNVPELAVNFFTACSGLYIAIFVTRRLGRNKTQSDTLSLKFEKAWADYSLLSNEIQCGQIRVRTLATAYKKFNVSIQHLKRYFRAFEMNENCLIDLEQKIDVLEAYISNNYNAVNNVYSIQSNLTYIKTQNDDVDLQFASILKIIIEKI